MKLFLCWYSIMVPSFGYGQPSVSSSRIESNFNQLKNRVFNQETLPIRVDSFIQEIVPYYRGDNLLHRATSLEECNVYLYPDNMNTDKYQNINKYSNTTLNSIIQPEGNNKC